MNSSVQSAACGVAFSCDASGKILSVLHDDFGITENRTGLVDIVDQFSREKAGNFVRALNQEHASFGWELNVRMDERIVPVAFNGAAAGDDFLIVGASTRSAAVRFVEALSSMNNEQTTALRSALKQLSEEQRQFRDEESSLFDELSRVNNELVTVQRELARKNRELEKLNLLKDTFLAMASHDLRKPISGILTTAGLLLDPEGPSPAEQQKLISGIKDAGHKVIKQLNDFLDIAQIEAGKLRIDKHSAALAPIVAMRAAAFQPTANAKKIKLTAEIVPDIPPLPLDTDRIEQVVDNLLENAVKYTPVGGAVSLRLRKSGSKVTLSVSDTGPGIRPDQLQLLFAPFQTAGSKTTAREKSTGLGLAIVKAIVSGHGGTVAVQNEPGSGATFTVALPIP